MRLFVLVAAGAVAVALTQAGCETSRPLKQSQWKPVPNPERLAGFRPEEIKEASALHAIKCAKCHQFYNPADYEAAEWRSWMQKMSKKARLTLGQKELLSRYLDTFRN